MDLKPAAAPTAGSVGVSPPALAPRAAGRSALRLQRVERDFLGLSREQSFPVGEQSLDI